MPDDDRFRLGVNYWPADVGMRWLAAYDPAGTESDFRRIAAAGLDTVRVFLRWEDVQPSPGGVDARVLDHVVDAADAAQRAGVELVVTLFTGHMSGVNWIPGWAVGGISGDPRFRVVSGGRVQPLGVGLRNWYSDPEVVAAQERCASETARALAGHPAVWAWDLGNENSNCTVPPDHAAADAWLERMTGVLRAADPGRVVTIGIHMEDLEHDRALGPAEAARWCDVVCMHGYPGYATWADGPTDTSLVPFLAHVTRWLAGGAPVLFEELGIATLATTAVDGARSGLLVDEVAAAAYVGDVVDGLIEVGCVGALLWCFTDYAPALHAEPPFDDAPHERSFGLWRADGTAKPAVARIGALRGTRRQVPAAGTPSWIDVSVDEVLADRRHQLARLYRRYQAAVAADLVAGPRR